MSCPPRHPPPHAVLLVAALTACQEPFGADRHDLVADRIAAVTAAARGSELVLHPWLVVDGRPWSDAAPDVRWYNLDPEDPDVDVIAPETATALAVGPVATVPRTGAWGLIVRFPSGAEARAQLVTSPSALPLVGAARLQVGLLDLDFDEATEEELALDARRGLSAEPVTGTPSVPAGRWSRLSLGWDAVPPDLDRVRWMSTSRRSTFLELDAGTTDWATGELVLDDLEIEEATPLSPGPTTALALAVSTGGLHQAFAADIWVGDPEPGVITRGRWLGTAAAGAVLTGTLVADDEAPTGLRLQDAVASDSVEDWGTDALPCHVAVSGPFDPSWLFDGSCSRAQVVGQRVSVEVE